MLNSYKKLHTTKKNMLQPGFDALELKKVENMDVELEKQKEEPYKVQHSIIDFRYLILGYHLREKKKLVFDHYYLSNLIDSTFGNEAIFSTNTIKKIINLQFSIAAPTLEKLLYLYMICFFIPFLLTSFIDNILLQWIFYCLGLVPLTINFFIELVQIKYAKGSYITESLFNVIEFL